MCKKKLVGVVKSLYWYYRWKGPPKAVAPTHADAETMANGILKDGNVVFTPTTVKKIKLGMAYGMGVEKIYSVVPSVLVYKK